MLDCDEYHDVITVLRIGCTPFVPQIINANSMQLPLEDSSVDAYLSSFGACCVADFQAMLKEALRVLKPGGRAAFSLRNEVSGGRCKADSRTKHQHSTSLREP